MESTAPLSVWNNNYHSWVYLWMNSSPFKKSFVQNRSCLLRMAATLTLIKVADIFMQLVYFVSFGSCFPLGAFSPFSSSPACPQVSAVSIRFLSSRHKNTKAFEMQKFSLINSTKIQGVTVLNAHNGESLNVTEKPVRTINGHQAARGSVTYSITKRKHLEIKK